MFARFLFFDHQMRDVMNKLLSIFLVLILVGSFLPVRPTVAAAEIVECAGPITDLIAWFPIGWGGIWGVYVYQLEYIHVDEDGLATMDKEKCPNEYYVTFW